MTEQPVPTKAVSLEAALCDHLAPLGWTVTRTPVDLQDKVRQHDAVIRVSQLPGGERTWQRIVRVRVEVFTGGYDAMWAKAGEVSDALEVGTRTKFWAGGWLVDRCVSESDFTETFYTEGVRMAVGIVRVTTRS